MAEDSDNTNELELEIERIFNETNDLDQIQTQVIKAVREHTKDSPLKDSSALKQIEATIGEIFAQPKSKSASQDKGGGSVKNHSQEITKESKENLKTSLKQFAIYEVYKGMNPRRIAGETEQMNYAANFERRGQEKAEEYVKESKVSEQERKQIRRKVRKKMRARGRMSLRRESSAELDLVGNSKSKTVNALDLASRLRNSLEAWSSGVVVSKSKARELQHRQQAEEHKNPTKEQGQGRG